MLQTYRCLRRHQLISRRSASSTRELTPTLYLFWIQMSQIPVVLTLQLGPVELVSTKVISTKAVVVVATLTTMLQIALVVTTHSRRGFHMHWRMGTRLGWLARVPTFAGSLAWITSERSMADDYIVTTTGTEISLSEDANSVALASSV
jgi:hypothetical protein